MNKLAKAISINILSKPYYSHEINLRKPSKECFEFVLKNENLNAEETLFIDDSETNIEGCKKSWLKHNSFTIATYNSRINFVICYFISS